MKPTINLGNVLVDADSSPFIIAEIGVNHEGSIDIAKKLIDLAKEGGASAAKFQSYRAETLASKNSPSYWDTTKESTKSQFELFQKYDSFSPDDYIELAAHCESQGIGFASTPFDDQAVDFLAPLVPYFKIASADLTNIPFVRKIAAAGKPVILSTGASTMSEIDLAVNALSEEGCNDVALLHCILNYPTSHENAHLRMIRGLQRAYPDKIIGYSDHTVPDEEMNPLITAFLLGAVILEKHFTHDKTLPGNDHYHAMDVHDLKLFTKRIQDVRSLMGASEIKQPLKSEEISRLNARRSIVLNSNIHQGQVLTGADLTYKRPGTGISPIHWDEVIGSRAVANLEADHVLQWRDIESVQP